MLDAKVTKSMARILKKLIRGESLNILKEGKAINDWVIQFRQ